MDVRQIQSFGMGVNFEETAALARLPDNAKHVHLIGLTPADQPPAGMGQDREVRMVHRLHDALGLPAVREVEAAVHRADHQIQPAEHLIRQIQIPVF